MCDESELDTGESLEMRGSSGLWPQAVWDEKVVSYGIDVEVQCSHVNLYMSSGDLTQVIKLVSPWNEE